jgi:putative ABC transport system permease protein
VTGAVTSIAAAGLRGRSKAGLVATFAVLVLAALGIAAGLAVARQGATLLDRVAAEANVAHLVVYGDASTLREVAADPEVKASAGPFATANAEMAQGTESISVAVTALDDHDVPVGRPVLRAGRWVTGAEEIVVDRSFAADRGLRVGDQLELKAGNTAAFTVVGTAVNLTDCFYPQCDPGRVWVTGDGIRRLDPGRDEYGQLWLRFADASDADPFVQRQAEAGVEGIGGTESWLDTRGDFLTLDRVFGAFVTAFGLFVVVAAAVVVAGSMTARLVERRREIGLLGAVGFTPRQVSTALLLEHLTLGLAATLTGWFLAGFLAPRLQLGIGAALGSQGPAWTVFGLAVAALVIGTILTLATLGPARRAAHRPVTELLRDAPIERTSRLSRRLARRLASVPRRLSLLGVRDVASRPGRAALTSMAIAVAVVGAVVSVGFIGAVDTARADSARVGDPWDVTVVTTGAPAAETEAELAADPRIDAWYSELGRRSTFNDGAFSSIAIGGRPDDARFRIGGGRPLRTAGEAIAGYGFLKRFGVAVGDEITFLAGTTPLTVRIVGRYRETDDSGDILRYRIETLTTKEPSTTPDVYRVTGTKGTSPAALAEEIEQRAGSGVRVEPIDTSSDDLDTFTVAIRLVALVLILMAGINLLTSLLTTTRESARRVGVEEAVGFTPRQLIGQGAVAGATLGLAAVAVGVPVGLLLFGWLSDLVSDGIGVGPDWMPMPTAGQLGLVAVLALAASGGLGALAVGRLARRPAAELVRWE